MHAPWPTISLSGRLHTTHAHRIRRMSVVAGTESMAENNVAGERRKAMSTQ